MPDLFSKILIKIFCEDLCLFDLQCGRVNLPMSSPQQANNRIMGGFNVTEHKYPWVVSLQTTNGEKFFHSCTGSILSKTAILTAAHCDHGATFHIVFGTNDKRLTKGNIKAKKIILHPDYVSATSVSNFDAMIVILEEPIIFTKDVGPICLPGKEEIQEYVCTWLIRNYNGILATNSIN